MISTDEAKINMLVVNDTSTNKRVGKIKKLYIVGEKYPYAIVKWDEHNSSLVDLDQLSEITE